MMCYDLNHSCHSHITSSGVWMQPILCADGAAGVNFEHRGVDGHTGLRYKDGIFACLSRYQPSVFNKFAVTEGLMLLTHSINHPNFQQNSLILYLWNWDGSFCPSCIFGSNLQRWDWAILSTRMSIGHWNLKVQCRKDFITNHGFSWDMFIQWHSRGYTFVFTVSILHFGSRNDIWIQLWTDQIECTHNDLHSRIEAISTVSTSQRSTHVLFWYQQY